MPDLRSTPIDLKVRKDTRFDFASLQSPIHSGDNVYTSHFFNALSLMTPITEGILIRAIREAQPMLEGSGLEADAQAFIGQEATHTREHRALNRRLEELGIDVEQTLEDINERVNLVESSMSLQERLALVVTGEHVIYSISRALLISRFKDSPQHPEVKKLFVWHALEEMEHQSVCDDIYRYLYGSGAKHKLLYSRIFTKATRLLMSTLKQLMQSLLSQGRRPERGEYKAFLLWLTRTSGIATIASKELLLFFKPGFEHWSRSKEDQQLISAHLSVVFPLKVAEERA